VKVRTEYSTNLAYGKIERVFEHLLTLECEYMPISDRYSTFGWIEWQDLCAKHNKKPIYGVELGVSNNAADKKPSISYFTFFALDSVRIINDLVALATSQPGALLTYEQANNVMGAIAIADNRVILDLCSRDAIWISLSPSTPIGLYNGAKDRGFQFVASSDNVFPTAQDKDKYRVLLGRQSSSATYDQFIQSLAEWDKSVSHFDRQDRINAVYNRTTLEGRCKASLVRARLPRIDAPVSLADLCLAGAARLGMELDAIYMDRLGHELAVIAAKGFEDYFYIVADLMMWARERMIVSPGRGSSAGSLVCFLLGITSVDPLKYNLLFERFLDVTRKDLPDIDMDFPPNKRDLVFNYLEMKYGKEHFGKLANVTRFQAKSIINVAATSLKIPMWLSSKAAEELHEHASLDARAITSFENSFKFGTYSNQLRNEYPNISLIYDAENHAKNFSVHAAGAVITDGSIAECVAVDSRNETIMADKNTAEQIGLLKLDLLSVNQLAVFARTLELIGVEETNAFLEQIPLNEVEAFDIINRKKYAGIFQMGRALINLFKYFHVTKLEDIIAVTSLARPGPLSSGGAMRWVNRRIGISDIQYAHPCLEPYLTSTFGEVVYQEQLMQIAAGIGGMSIEDVSSLRKAVGKSKGAEALRPYGDKFKLGAARFGFIGDEVEQFWNDLCGFGAYSFNRSHAVSYSLITYYCCWLKAYYPVEFAAATLDAEPEPTNQITLLRELHAEGVKYVPIDAATSTDRWTIKTIVDGAIASKTLVGPLTSIKGIGPAALKQIIEARQSGKELPPGLAKKLAEAVTPIDSLTPVATAVARCVPDLKAVNIISAPVPIASLDKGDRGSFLIIGLLTGLKKKDRNDAESVQRRNGRKLTGNTLALNLTIKDDSGADIIAIIDPSDYDAAAPKIIERGGIDKAIYAIKGTIPDKFRMLSVQGIRFLCNIDDGLGPIREDFFAPQIVKEDFFAVPKEIANGDEPVQSDGRE